MKMEEKHKLIWKMALLFQDYREDKGHAEITLNFAQKLLKSEKADPDIVIPAIILHDVGWSQLSETDYLLLRPGADPKEERKVRIKHQKEGVKVAKIILTAARYDKNLADLLLEIISQHDTRKKSISKEDAVTRDADKLWQYSKIGFRADLRRKEICPRGQYEYLKKSINQKEFLFTESAKVIARKELEQRRKEFEL